MRKWLIQVARAGGKVTYGEMMDVFGEDRFSLRYAMDRLGHEAQQLGEPIITALIVSKETGSCSAGLEKEFGVSDDESERARLHIFWQTAQNPISPSKDRGLDSRAARFVSIESRPDQARFRRAVFLACDGCCVVSGCDVEDALDAAHKHGRDWRAGHNEAADGYLLRKDLHALYDAGLLRISDEGIADLSTSAMPHYGIYQGRNILPISGRAP